VNLEFSYPLVLLLLPLALLPFFRSDRQALAYGWLKLLPRDVLGSLVGMLLKLLAACAIAALIIGLSGIHRSEAAIERVGRGAQIVILLDRSRSMDEMFNQGRVNHDPSKVFNEQQQREIKGKVARKILADFAAKRPQDRFGMVGFSAYPMHILDFTQKQEVIQAAIRAGDVGRGLSETDIARGLFASISYFDNQPYTGSRIILLVSDGGARIDAATREKLSKLMKQNRVGLYWIYLRSVNSPGLFTQPSDVVAGIDSSPEIALHDFFKSIKTPYHAYEAENSSAILTAVQDVNRLENLPISFNEIVPRRDLSWECYLLAAFMLIVMLITRMFEVKAWR
jgi:mxaC protein